MNIMGKSFNPELAVDALASAWGLLDIARSQSGPTLLVIALRELELFEILRKRPMSMEELRRKLKLSRRAIVVLMVALREMKTVRLSPSGCFHITKSAELSLLRSSKTFIGDYLALMVSEPAVKEMFSHLRNNRPKSWHGEGTAFTYRRGKPSALNGTHSARFLTLALHGVAKAVAPVFAARVNLEHCNSLLDVGAGTGLYAFAALQRYPHLHAMLLDRPEVLRTAKSIGAGLGLLDRVTFKATDMLSDALPNQVDAILLSNVIHDWDIHECQQLINRCAKALVPGGRLLIHDRFQSTNTNTALSEALHSANLFLLTEGRLYSVKEVSDWCRASKLRALPQLVATADGYAILESIRPK
jgi:16S rRNA G1207 methylase RsmC